MPALILVVLAVGIVAVGNARSVFGSQPVMVTPIGSDSAKDLNPKMVTYEVFGSGTSATINYLNLDGNPQRAGGVEVPWSLTLTTTSPSTSPNILAQSDGNTISCRITVDDVVKDERTATGMNAETFCLVKFA
ncbi:MmpS family transport accessory protein [Mycolicibacterium frederiksbergense]|uniref:MmpS family transport accessory protein n=1 Tax=Mycolicibacterium frederiksbergense TaxID=117567 RepID=UPI00399A91DC